jgi:ribonucleoside-diphosphate reductase beta chain
MILDHGYNLTLRPMKYPQFYEMYKNALKNTWTVEEISFHRDLPQLRTMTPAERHMVQRLVAFFATGDSLVSNNLVLNLYQAVNAPEARMYLSRQLFEEALHVQFYLTLLDNYVPDPLERERMFDAVNNVPSVAAKAKWMAKWMDEGVRSTHNIIAFSSCVEGLFFYGAFAYIFYMKDRGLLPGLADGTNWVMRDETMHMNFAFEVVDIARREDPMGLGAIDEGTVRAMITSAVDAESVFAQDALSGGIVGLSTRDMRSYLEYVADQRLARLGLVAEYGAKNPFPFMDQQGMMPLANFFERRVSEYQTNVTGEVTFDESF